MSLLDQMHPVFIAFIIIGMSVFIIIALSVLVRWGIRYRRKQKQQEKEWDKQHPSLALIALPVVYLQAHEDGVIIQDSKQRLHYFSKHRGYSWEPLENIEI